MNGQFSFEIGEAWVAALVKQSSHGSSVQGFAALGYCQMKRSVALGILHIDVCTPRQKIIKCNIRTCKRCPVERCALLQILFVDIKAQPHKERN
jgi:hypothetical protein